jgi:hypothetical protein
MEEIRAGGTNEPIFDEVLQVGWQRQETARTTTRIVGKDARASLFFVQDDGMLHFTPMPPSVTHFRDTYPGPVTLRVTLQALSTEINSDPVTIQIVWQGVWHEGETEIQRYCTVSRVS